MNALSFDLEYWYSAELVRKFVPDERDDQVVEAVNPLLDLLDKYDTKATFFVLGKLAEQYPELIKKIHENGHEIGSHSYSHKTLYDLGKENFEFEFKKTNSILRAITGESPIGFRAPTFSIDNSTSWAFDILENYGYKYDSSIFPIKTNLYGVPKAPIIPYKPLKNDVTKEDPTGSIIEFPLSVMKLGWNIPISGGFYLRLLPIYLLKNAIKYIHGKRAVILFIHPWEIYSNTQRVPLPHISRFITYHGINSSFNKLEILLQNFRFAPIREVLEL